jgi:(p)ppGpp synthase/HD superfamily hydrolase
VITAGEADRLAAALLGDLRTKLGGLHIAHARRVAAGVDDLGDEAAVAAALLHDVVEKAGVSFGELLSATGDQRVVELVDILTQRPGESEHHYLSRCMSHPIALAIKRVDLIDKLEATDAAVGAVEAAAIRSTARQRLDLLERLARTAGL